MRFIVYVVAVLAAAGIVYFIGSSNPPATNDVAQQSAESAPAATSADAPAATPVDAAAATELVSLKVPEMHCPFACYPSVKSTLEGQTGVASVELVEQKEDGVIDNPVVLIKASTDFDIDQAIAALAKSGFADSQVVQQ